MSKQKPLLQLRFDGQAIGASRVPLGFLLSFLPAMEKAFVQTGQVLTGGVHDTGRKQSLAKIKKELGLYLVQLTHGSEATVMGFDRKPHDPSFPRMDLGLEILKTACNGLDTVQKDQPSGGALPPGFDEDVLRTWCTAGSWFDRGVDKISLTLTHPDIKCIQTSYTPEGLRRIKNNIQGPKTESRIITGHLLMADFKEGGAQCRIHPSTGESVRCLFTGEQAEEVLENLLHYVRITGEEQKDPRTGKIYGIRIHDIEQLGDGRNAFAKLRPQKASVFHDFWESPSIEEIAARQNVKPITDINTILGTWPGEKDDDFEKWIDELRHPERSKS